MMDWGRRRGSYRKKLAVAGERLGDTHLYEPEDGEGRRAVVAEHEADDAEELGVEAAVTEAEQEAAEQGQLDAEQQHRQVKAKT